MSSVPQEYRVDGIPPTIRAKITTFAQAARDQAFAGAQHPGDHAATEADFHTARYNLERTIKTEFDKQPFVPSMKAVEGVRHFVRNTKVSRALSTGYDTQFEACAQAMFLSRTYGGTTTVACNINENTVRYTVSKGFFK